MATESESQRHVSFRKIFRMSGIVILTHADPGRNIIITYIPISRPPRSGRCRVRVWGRDNGSSESGNRAYVSSDNSSSSSEKSYQFDELPRS
ncbi:hypothetical protein AAC387_Pa11g0702 [Persea americana]